MEETNQSTSKIKESFKSSSQEKKPFSNNSGDNRRGGSRNFGGGRREGGFGKFAKDNKGGRFGRRGGRNNNRRNKPEEKDDFDSQVIQVKRVTRVVKGGKRMRFAALVVVGDKKGKVGYGLKKGMDFQESVAKATRQAKNNLIDLKINENGTFEFLSLVKYKATSVMLKPANSGTGLISGGFVRPVLELAGLKNCYTKIIGSNNKVSGVQAVFEALKQYAK